VHESLRPLCCAGAIAQPWGGAAPGVQCRSLLPDASCDKDQEHHPRGGKVLLQPRCPDIPPLLAGRQAGFFVAAVEKGDSFGLMCRSQGQLGCP